MAKMMPAHMDPDVRSAAERRLFEKFATDPGTEGWTVLHSLGLARRSSGPYGEVDFVVVIPGRGILCIEVKGGRVSCEDGVWRSRDRSGQEHRLGKSPFLQAREAMFAVKDAIADHFGRGSEEARVPIDYAVAFPDVGCPPPSPEFERGEVMDADDLRGPISAAILRVADGRLREFLRGRRQNPLPPDLAGSIAGFLRPSFDLVVSRSVALGRVEEAMISLTDEQYERLDELADNRRCVFQGAAGTGKTLLAIEYAQRAQASGKSVALACFNLHLGGWLDRQTEGTGVTAGGWYEGILRDIILKGPSAEEFIDRERKAKESGDEATLYDVEYPLHSMVALEGMEAPFDVLVMDEAQDLFREGTLDVMDRLIRGGVAGGRWAIFGDFTGQTIFDSNPDPLSDLSAHCDHYVRAKLTRNCRNTRNIAREMAMLGGFDPPRLRPGQHEGPPVIRRFSKTPARMLRALEETLEDLRRDGLDTNDVIVLSPRRLENSALDGVAKLGDAPIVDCSRLLDAPPDCVRFSTIHSFKGMESRAVIIIDIDDFESDWMRALLYVGMSRARSLLVLMLNERDKPAYDALLREAG